jgi:hypothetical protein
METRKMRDARRTVVVLGLALSALAPAGLAGDEAEALCGGGRDVLIQDWSVEGLPGTEGRPTRATLECLGDGRIRQVVEVSSDGGRTWSPLFESTYSPVAADPVVAATPAAATAEASASPPAADPSLPGTPAAPTSPPPAAAEPSSAPAPVPPPAAPAQHQAARQAAQEGSDVQALSRELERTEIPADQAPELVMASPLVLEITPGQLDDYPENTAWVTDETAGFVCDHVIVKKVSAARKTKGGGVQLVVGAQLFTKKRSRSLDLLVEVLADGQVVATGELKKVRIGLNIPGHDKTGMMVDTALDMSVEQFDRLFGGAVEPKLRLTMTVPAA